MTVLHASRLLFGAALMASPALAQNQDSTVWSSFIYLRAGERTPNALNTANTLTSLGAQQLYSAGQYFRSQYLQDGSTSRIQALDADEPLQEQVYALTLDTQYTSASTQSFLLGMYPPNTAGSSNTSSSTIGSTNILANGSFIENPQGGMNFPRISTAGLQDINSLYVSGDLACNAFGRWARSGIQIDELVRIEQESQATYDSIQTILDPAFNRSVQTFDYAKSIYDYVNYLNTYNRTIAEELSSDDTIMDRLRYYADQQQTAFYGNLAARNPYNRQPLWATSGSISTIAGASLAARVNTHFYGQQLSRGSTRLTVLVGDYAPMLSLFALLNLRARNNDFNGLPLPGSAIVFELISPSSASTNLTSTGLPSLDELSVRFRFRNGTGISASSTLNGGGDLTTYALFNRSADDVAIPYNDFLAAMSDVSISSPGDWCFQCGAETLFCAAWNSSLSYDNGVNPNGSPYTGYGGTAGRRLTNEAAGAIGAVVALVVAGLVAALLFWVVGLRFRRTEPLWVSAKRRHDLGGFKGSAKLASDRDLSSPRAKDGTVVGATVVEKQHNRFSDGTAVGSGNGGGDGHVRMGSWELKDSPAASPRVGHGGGPASESASASDLARARASVTTAGLGSQPGEVETAREVEFYKPGWPQGRRIVRDSEGTLVERDLGHMGLDGARMGWGSRDEGDHRPLVNRVEQAGGGVGGADAPGTVGEAAARDDGKVEADVRRSLEEMRRERESGMMEREPGRRMSMDSDKIDPFRDPIKVEERV